MQRDIDKILISQVQIARRVRELAEQITIDHSPPAIAEGGEITIVPIMTGAMIFCADLMRQIPIAMKIGMLTVSSYPGRSVRSQGVQFLANQVGEIKGRHVLVLDDILDSGNTLSMVLPAIAAMGPISVKCGVLLRKKVESARHVPVDYVGFEIPNEFVVGYGLDFNNYYRNLPDIVTLKSRVTAGST